MRSFETIQDSEYDGSANERMTLTDKEIEFWKLAFANALVGEDSRTASRKADEAVHQLRKRIGAR